MDNSSKKQQLKNSQSLFRRLLILSFRLSVIVFLILFILIVLLHVPAVQKKAGDRIIVWIADKLDKEIKCGSYHLSLLGTLEIRDLVIRHNPRFGNEPLASIDYLYAVFGPLSISEDKIRVRELYVKNPVFRIIYSPEKMSNLFKDDYVRKKKKSARSDDDSKTSAVFERIQVDHIVLKNVFFELDYQPSNYFLRVPNFNLEGHYLKDQDVLRTTVSGCSILNKIPGKLNSKADLRILADVYGGGISNGLITINSNNGKTWLYGQCKLENFHRPRLTFTGSAIFDLQEISDISELSTSLSGNSSLVFQGSGLAEDLTVSGNLFSNDIQFNKFRFADFSGRVLYNDQIFTIPEAQGKAYNGKYTGKGEVGFARESKFLDLSILLNNANLALLTKDLEIPFRFKSNTNASVTIRGESFIANDLVIRGITSGTEFIDKNQHESPMHLSGEFEMTDGIFRIPKATFENSTHKIILENGVFDKKQLLGRISGHSNNLNNLLSRIQRCYPKPFDPPVIEGNTAFSVVLGGSLNNYDISTNIEIQNARFKDQDMGSIQIASSINPRYISVNSLSVDGKTINANGSLQIRFPRQTTEDSQFVLDKLDLNVDRMDLSVLDNMFEKSIPLTGIASGEIFMNIPESEKTITTRLTAASITYANVPAKNISLQGNLALDGFTQLRLTANPGTGKLVVSGNISFESGSELEISGQDIPISI
ncbi:hypothetical protein K8T06_07760, partial [bacterium]|nr:hypothetical protein [bacterium]